MMKKTILTLMSAFALLFCREICAQPETTPRPERRRIAVYIVAGEGVHNDVKSVVNNQIINVLNRTDKYVLIERNNDFALKIDSERKIQQSGNVRDDQITDLAREFGAVAVCIAELVSFMGELSVDMRLTSVTTKTIIPGRTGSNQGRYNGIAEIRKIVDGAAAAMLGGTANGLAMGMTSNARGTSSGQNLTFTANGATFEMVFVKGGSFTMGCTLEQGSDCGNDEKPPHRVNLPNYYIGKYEVTQLLWRAVMGDNPSNWKSDDLPVENISWNDCQTFISRLNNLTGKQFRLPTEAEWEYAARGGNKSKNYKYSGGNDMYDVGWYTDNSGSKTHAVGSKRPNELGIYDMSGNVWEWCRDWYSATYYGGSPMESPTGASSGSLRVLRGGSWGENAQYYCRVFDRGGNTPSYRGTGLGFRLSLVP